MPDLARPGLSRAATVACAVACGAMVANLYYAQPLIGLIAPDLGLRADIAGLIVTLTQLGYGAGLLLIVPLADRVENRRLIVTTVLATAAGLAGVATAPNAGLFLAAAMAAGACAAGAQVVVPFAASLAPEERRGRTIGNVMAGLLAGIMLARPAASLVSALLGWRAIFWLSAGLMLLLAGVLRAVLPQRRPEARDGYGAILRSLGRILMTTPPLRRRALYQGLLFAAFNIFWTAVPLLLAQRFGFGQEAIALFALAGAGGALAAPLAGALGDRGYVRAGTGIALATVALCFLLAGVAGSARSVLLLVLFAVLLDAAVQVNQVLGQRVIYSLPGEERGRLNAVYMTCAFLLGAGGSATATVAFHAGGWWGAVATGAGLALLALGAFAAARGR